MFTQAAPSCPTPFGTLPFDANGSAHAIARSAVRALYMEVALEPKPGLVSLRDNGSHTDMDAATFVRSLFALRHYFGRAALAGWQGTDLVGLQTLGLAAEARMLRATQGVNTHKGAIFGLGLLCAAAGRLNAQGQALHAQDLRDSLLTGWGAALVERAAQVRAAPPVTNGQKAARAHGLRSALDEAALGFPAVFEVALPALQTALLAGVGERAARVQALFATMAVLDDTNLVHRGGLAGLHWMKAQAQEFLAAGGVGQAQWQQQARALHQAAVQRRLSPGGSADVLASACWLASLQPSTVAIVSAVGHTVEAMPAPAYGLVHP